MSFAFYLKALFLRKICQWTFPLWSSTITIGRKKTFLVESISRFNGKHTNCMHVKTIYYFNHQGFKFAAICKTTNSSLTCSLFYFEHYKYCPETYNRRGYQKYNHKMVCEVCPNWNCTSWLLEQNILFCSIHDLNKMLQNGGFPLNPPL